MRLNQLAKKVGRPYTRVEKYIKKDLGVEGIEGPNSKVADDIVEKVIFKFGLAPKVVPEKEKPKMETVEAKPAEISPEERGIEEVNISGLDSTPAELIVPNLEGLGKAKIEEVELVEEKEVVADSNIEVVVEVAEILAKSKIVETIETDETTLHVDQEGVIVAPKAELEGFKVRGKIDLPGAKAKKEVEAEEPELVIELTQEEQAEKDAKAEAEKLAKEETKAKAKADREKRVKAEAARAEKYKAEKEAKAQVELRKRIEEKKKWKKEEGKKHYLNKVQDAPVPKAKKKKLKALEISEDDAFEINEKYKITENMTTWDKIVRWFNT
jgi:hypothetical protein